ncbi:MAG TPA: tRNA 2-thiouridine(34) synthase MnmA [Gaiellaceae bacterium]|nr:tRNA 2-thiouridine(34) synthase MnmA [Gaiellaceae bacterium]
MRELIGDSARGEEWACVRLRVDGDRIVDADADGLAQDLRGLTLLEAAAVGGDALPVDALANAIAPAVRATFDENRVAVGVSGGVDSAVALIKAGPLAVGVTLRLWLDPRGPDAERVCCSPNAVLAARKQCHELGLPHITLDRREAFRRSIVESFVRGYERGDTPNPCIRCNGSFRFAELLALARRIGAARLATGHYARIVERDGTLLLARALDMQKDQSYMLARVDPRFLDRLWFPLGEQTKADTRAQAEEHGLAAAHRAESQEACFLAGDDYRPFLERQGLAAEPGAIVDEDGRKLGEHDGYWRFTPGQRRGLGVSAAEPLYALNADPVRNTVTVGPRASLARTSVTARGRMYAPATSVDAKLRYRSPAVGAAVEATASGFRLTLDQPAYGVARGQAAVLYDGDVVVGAGLVTSARG